MARTRKDLKDELNRLQKLLRTASMTTQNRMDVSDKIFLIQEQILHEGDVEMTETEILRRRDLLFSHRGIVECFESFWFTMRGFTVQNEDDMEPHITEEGYKKINRSIQFALCGNSDEDATFNAEVDWERDSMFFGQITKVAFFDILYDIAYMWTSSVDMLYFAAFTWTLLTAICDVSKSPPKLRARRAVKNIMESENEASMLTGYIGDKEQRLALKREIEAESSRAQSAERASRQAARKRGELYATSNDESTINDIEILETFALRWHNDALKRQNENENTDTDTDTDNDDDTASRRHSDCDFGIDGELLNNQEKQTFETALQRWKRLKIERDKERAERMKALHQSRSSYLFMNKGELYMHM